MNRNHVIAAIGGMLIVGSSWAQAQESSSAFPEALAPLPEENGESQFAESNNTAFLPAPQRSAALQSPDESRPRAEVNAGHEISSIPKRFQYGVRLSLRGVYDDNIFLTNAERTGDFYLAIEPGLTIGFGDIVGREPNFIRFDYAPSLFLYADHSDANALQHVMRLEGQYRFGHLSLGLSQDILLLEGSNPASIISGSSQTPTVNLDAGGDTEVNTYTTNAILSYDLTGKTFLSGGLHYTVYDYDTLIGSEQVSGDLFINYNYSPKLVVGLGGTAGYNWVDSPSPDQSFEQVNARMTYQISGKVSLHASGGVEFRQSEGDLRDDDSDHISPVYEVGATYQPFDGTSVTASGSRRTMNSAVLVAQDYASTNITVGIRQRLLQRIYLGLAVGYENSDYFSTVDSVNASRVDDYFFVQPAIDVTLTRFWTVGVYYLHRQNESSSDFFSFNDNQFGVRTSIIF